MKIILIPGLLLFAQYSLGQYPYIRPYSPTPNYVYPGTYGPKVPNTIFKNTSITVVTKQDSSFSFIGTLEAGFNLVVVGKKGKQYSPKDTKEIILNSFRGQGRMRGISTDSTWLFRVVEGRINMYSRIPLNGDKEAIAIQKGNGEIVKLTMANLKEMIPEEERDLKLVDLFDQYKLQSIVKYYNKR